MRAILCHETTKSGVTGDETDEDSHGLKKAEPVQPFHTPKTQKSH
jgi:hypothetical protein